VGKFGLSGNDAMKPMRFLSGGQKSRAGKKGGREGGWEGRRRNHGNASLTHLTHIHTYSLCPTGTP